MTIPLRDRIELVARIAGHILAANRTPTETDITKAAETANKLVDASIEVARRSYPPATPAEPGDYVTVGPRA